MSQGYAIHLNDMHGKFKSKEVFAEAVPGIEETPVYKMAHKYAKSAHNKLNNLVNVVNAEGTITTKLIGKDIDMVVDLTSSGSYYKTQAINADLDISPLPIGVPSIWYVNRSRENKYKSSVTTKVIYSKGILEEIELIDNRPY